MQPRGGCRTTPSPLPAPCVLQELLQELLQQSSVAAQPCRRQQSLSPLPLCSGTALPGEGSDVVSSSAANFSSAAASACA